MSDDVQVLEVAPQPSVEPVKKRGRGRPRKMVVEPQGQIEVIK